MLKALILAGGRGSRLAELTDTKNKCMYEFMGQPLIEYSLQNATRVGVAEIVIVVGYKAESIINRFGNRYGETPIRYVIQREQKGLVHAIECSEETIGGADFMLFLADEVLLEPKHQEMLQLFRCEEVFALCGTVWVEDKGQISKTYSVIYDAQSGQIFRLVEKPRKALNNLMGTGNCVFRNDILDYIPYTPINQQRGEKELPDLIQCAIDDGRTVKAADVGGRYVNINTVDDIERLEGAKARQ